MTQQEYEAAISKIREIVLDSIDAFEKLLEEKKEEIRRDKNLTMLNSLLRLFLLVAHTEQGRPLFLNTLKFSSEIDAEIAIKYWNKFDDDIENLITKRYFQITIEQL